MPLPPSVSTGIITGTFLNDLGEPAKGTRIRFDPVPKRLLDSVDSVVLVMTDTNVSVDPLTGSFSVTLVATDDPDLNPINWTYAVTITSPHGGSLTFYIGVVTGSTVDLSTIPEVAGSAGQISTLGLFATGPETQLGVITTKALSPAGLRAATVTDEAAGDPVDYVAVGPNRRLPDDVSTATLPYVDVTWSQFAGGAVGDYDPSTGTGTDNTAAIVAAITAAGDDGVVYFPAVDGVGGDYLVTDTLVDGVIPVSRFSLVGPRIERGCNALAAIANAAYSAVRIVFRPTDTTKPLVRCYSTQSPLSSGIGPYELRNITLDIGDANGCVFGVHDPATPNLFVDDASLVPIFDIATQRHIFGVRIDGCAFDATRPDRVSTNGVMIPNNRRLTSFAKCFDTVVSNTSFLGGGTQIQTIGCDAPVFENIRMQGGNQPIDMQPSGTFGVNHRLRTVQIEGWTFGAIKALGVDLSAESLRTEQNDGTPDPAGSGRFRLSQTASITADTSTFTASASMTDILFPGRSIVELRSGTKMFRALVTAVSGTTVTYSTAGNILTFTDAAATIDRVHGYGLLVDFGTISGLSAGASLDCPAIVYPATFPGGLTIHGGRGPMGAYGDISAVVLANTAQAQPAKNTTLYLFGCDPVLLPNTDHPFVQISPARWRYGQEAFASSVLARLRLPSRPLFDAIAAIRRVWAFSPGDSWGPNFTPGDNILRQVPDETNTNQQPWVWWRRPSATGLLHFNDFSFPSDPTSFIRLRFRLAQDDSGVAATPVVTFLGDGGSASIGAITVGAAGVFKTYEYVLPVPVVWQGVQTTGSRSVVFDGAGYFLQGAVVEEFTADDLSVLMGAATTVAPAAGGADALPATPLGYLTTYVNGVARKVAYY